MGGVGTRKNKSIFNVKTVREYLCVTSGDPSSGFVMIWNGWATAKANMLAWKSVDGRLLTKTDLEKKGEFRSATHCARVADHEQETVEHILITCLMSKTLWWMWHIFPKKKKKVVNYIVMATLWIIWSSRNGKVFKVVQFSNDIRLEQVNECTLLWMKVIAKMENLVTEEWYTSGVNSGVNVIEN
ncbi:uncharacterized protein LOC110893346 [Helianthus annuus]|uniref:uncharacterized protein LOC110893346 n=1 Tax=Helianthus annuus TaxID=4232 RepID=UPI000B8FA64F|nr:uncharacterized protein LOC110893346 [Helianthus annuus]